MSVPQEVHHRTPRHLLGLRARADAADLTGAGIELWMEFEHEAMRYGVPVEITAEDLAALIEASAVVIPANEHRAGHSAAGDFARWGRRGGLRTLALYGPSWFKGLALVRWKKIEAGELEAYR